MAATAAATSSMAVTGVVLVIPRISINRCSAVPFLPPRSSTRSVGISYKQLLVKQSRRLPVLQTRATSSEESSAPSVDAGEVFTDLKEKLDAVENKTTLAIYGGGAIVAVWLSSIIVGAVNSVPLLPNVMELIGLGYTGWFVNRYLLFKSTREELANEIESIKKKIEGSDIIE